VKETLGTFINYQSLVMVNSLEAELFRTRFGPMRDKTINFSMDIHVVNNVEYCRILFDECLRGNVYNSAHQWVDIPVGRFNCSVGVLKERV